MNRASGLIPLLLLLSFACAASASPDRYLQWSSTPQAEGVRAYQQYLDAQGLGRVAPMPSLLRSARSWRECRASEFALPPKALWPNVIPTLRVLRDLHQAGLVDPGMAASGYRDAELNRCAGGAARSRHVSNNALDFDLADSADNVTRLCEYWRTQGPALKLGLGFYTDTRIHLDTSGFRTWGSDHTRRTSLCNTPKPAL
jgi:uncharacterized protein YcbK (DUF882 family)